jgi:hypothetical protein
LTTAATALLVAAALEEVVVVARVEDEDEDEETLVEAGGAGITAGTELTAAIDEMEATRAAEIEVEGVGMTAAALELAKSEEKRAGTEMVSARDDEAAVGMLDGMAAATDDLAATSDEEAAEARRLGL